MTGETVPRSGYVFDTSRKGSWMEIKWEDPPEHAARIGSGKHRGKYLELALALREQPGRWALLHVEGQTRTEKGANATAQNIRRGKVKGFTPAGAYETAVDGTKIWVRFKGAATQSDEGEEDEEEGEDGDEASIMADPARVREWAANNGFKVPARGRLPRQLVEAYSAAVEKRPAVRAVRSS